MSQNIVLEQMLPHSAVRELEMEDLESFVVLSELRSHSYTQHQT